jgi:hypothetical protein
MVASVPFNRPVACPEIRSPPPHDPVNVPTTDVAVWLVAWNWKLPHELGSGTPPGKALDAQMPARDVGLDVAPPLLALVAVGPVTVVPCSNPHPTVSMPAERTAVMSVMVLTITNLWFDAQICASVISKAPYLLS